MISVSARLSYFLANWVIIKAEDLDGERRSEFCRKCNLATMLSGTPIILPLM